MRFKYAKCYKRRQIDTQTYDQAQIKRWFRCRHKTLSLLARWQKWTTWCYDERCSKALFVFSCIKRVHGVN